MRIIIGQGSCGIAAGAEKVRKALLNANVTADIAITGCIGMCWLEPIVDIYDDENKLTRLVKVGENDADAIASFVNDGDESAVEKLKVTDEDSEFLSKQTRIALRNCGVINPENIEEYIEKGGYQALKKSLGMTPEEVIDIIKTSGLAGRGGAGFPRSRRRGLPDMVQVERRAAERGGGKVPHLQRRRGRPRRVYGQSSHRERSP